MSEIIHRKYPPVPLVAVGALIINPETKEILLIKRGAEPGKGKYSIPGGMVELGETLIDAVKREIEEEVSIPIEILGVIYLDSIIEKDQEGRVMWHYVLIDFLARPLNLNAKPGGDAVEALWVNIEEAIKLPLTSHTKRLMNIVRSQIDRGISFFGLDNTCSIFILKN